jgi:prophage antirepressor-like protein
MYMGQWKSHCLEQKDVAEWIEHSNVSQMVQSIDEDEKLTLNIAYSEQQKHNELFLTENGVYEVLMLSRKPIAKEFKKGVLK